MFLVFVDRERLAARFFLKKAVLRIVAQPA